MMVLQMSQSNLMECTLCNQIAHPVCISAKTKTVGIVNDDLPNSWDCPLCIDKITPIRTPKKGRSLDSRRGSTESGHTNGNLSSAILGNPESSQPVASSDMKNEVTVKIEKEVAETKAKVLPEPPTPKNVG